MLRGLILQLLGIQPQLPLEFKLRHLFLSQLPLGHLLQRLVIILNTPQLFLKLVDL